MRVTLLPITLPKLAGSGLRTAGLPQTDPPAGFDAMAIIGEFFSRHAR